MTCTKCQQKEVTSPNITGELCTSCYFASKAIPKETKAMVEEVIETKLVQLGKKEPESEDNPSHIPSKKTEVPEDGKKYCQSCIERGYGLKLATREWNKGYFICEDCFQPLLNNVIGVEQAIVDRVKTEIKLDSPALTQFYNILTEQGILNIPEQFRFGNSEQVLSSRNDIFNHHAPAVVNQSLEQVKEKIETLQVMLFQIKVGLEPLHDYINQAKKKAREAGGISIEKSRESIKGPSKVKLSKLEKEAKVMLPHIKDPEERLKVYQKMVEDAKRKEFDKITGVGR